MKLVRNVRTGGVDLGAEAAKRYWNKASESIREFTFFFIHILFI